jgi:hypothetical protein
VAKKKPPLLHPHPLPLLHLHQLLTHLPPLLLLTHLRLPLHLLAKRSNSLIRTTKKPLSGGFFVVGLSKRRAWGLFEFVEQ